MFVSDDCIKTEYHYKNVTQKDKVQDKSNDKVNISLRDHPNQIQTKSHELKEINKKRPL